MITTTGGHVRHAGIVAGTAEHQTERFSSALAHVASDPMLQTLTHFSPHLIHMSMHRST